MNKPYIEAELYINEQSIEAVGGHEGSGAVMHIQELPLMEASAEVVCHNNGHILEVGFGMGLFATACYDLGVESYTIVEVHPQIIERVNLWAKERENVNIIQGDWHDENVLQQIKSRQYDGIYFDTHGDLNRSKFGYEVVDHTLKDNGVFCWYVGSWDNILCNTSANIQEELAHLTGYGIDLPVRYIKK